MPTKFVFRMLGAILAMVLAAVALVTIAASPAAAANAASPTPWKSGDPTFTSIPNRPIVGVNYHGLWAEQTPSIRAGVLDKFASAGVTMVRMDIAWNMIQPSSKSSYDPAGVSLVDTVMSEISARGMKVVPMFYYPPKWSSGRSTKSGEPGNYADYGNALAWAANRWKYVAPVWEMWNEPDLSDFWPSQDPVRFTNMIKVAYPIAKAANPTVKFIVGSPNYLGLANNWYSRMYAAGLAGRSDGLGVHPYMSPSDYAPEQNATGTARQWSIVGIADLRTLMARYGERDKAIYATEFGYSTHSNTGSEASYNRGVSEDVQAQYTLRAYHEMAKQGVVGAFVYTDRDVVDSVVQKAHYGILRRDLSPKKSYYAIRCAATNICGPGSSPLPTPTPTSTQSSGAVGVPTNVNASVTGSTSINVSWSAAAGATSYLVYRNDSLVSRPTSNSYADTGLSPATTYRYVVKATNGTANSAGSAVASATTSSSGGSASKFVALGSSWKYNDSGSDLGTSWRTNTYNDSGWPSGLSEIGYGDGGEATSVAAGRTTYYFRTSFNAGSSLTGISGLRLQALIDDGAAVYLNGTEIWRYNLPSGTITASTLAPLAISGTGETTLRTVDLPITGLQTGANVIAVEVHNQSTGSTDASFNVSLSAR